MRTPFQTSEIRALLTAVQDDSVFRLYAKTLIVSELKPDANTELPSVAESLSAIFGGLPTPELTPPRWWLDARKVAGSLPPFVYYYRPPRAPSASDEDSPDLVPSGGKWTNVDSLADAKPPLYGRGTLLLWRHARLDVEDPASDDLRWTKDSIKDFVTQFRIGRGGGSAT
jgi:hypothetical protein